MPLDWAKALYGLVGAAHPIVSLIVVMVLAALLAGAGWRAVGAEFAKDHRPAPAAHEIARQAPVAVPSPAPVPAVEQAAAQRSSGASSPNVVTHGPNSPVIISFPPPTMQPMTPGQDPKLIFMLPAPTMPPMIEGLTLTYRQVPSVKNDAPYAIEATVQVQSEIQGFGVGFVCDQPLVGGLFSIGGVPAVIFGETTGTLNEAPERSYFVKFEQPALTPRRPLIVTLFSKQPFRVTKVARIVD